MLEILDSLKKIAVKTSCYRWPWGLYVTPVLQTLFESECCCGNWELALNGASHLFWRTKEQSGERRQSRSQLDQVLCCALSPSCCFCGLSVLGPCGLCCEKKGPLCFSHWAAGQAEGNVYGALIHSGFQKSFTQSCLSTSHPVYIWEFHCLFPTCFGKLH